jgi:outer membrane protein assembly factor BamB
MKRRSGHFDRIAAGFLLASAAMLWGCGDVSTTWAGQQSDAWNSGRAGGGPMSTPTEVWRRDAGVNPDGAAVATNGTAYLPHRGGVLALRISDGSEVWSREYRNFMNVSPAISDHGLLVGRHDGKIQCLSYENGEQVWGARIAWRPLGGITVDRGRAFVQSQEPKTPNVAETRGYGIDTESGGVKWEIRYGYGAPTAPAAREEFVYITDRNQLQIRRWDTGEEEITADQGYLNWVGSPVLGEAQVFYTGYTGRRVMLIAQDAAIGGENWRRELESRYSSRGPAYGNGKLYWVVPSKGLLVVDPETGRDLLTIGEAGEAHVHPILTPQAVYWVTGKTLFAADPETGTGLWTYGLDSEPYYMLLADETLLLGLKDDSFVALRAP